jgi:beta-lactamase regulating signal transducer with metallopeptidase domain
MNLLALPAESPLIGAMLASVWQIALLAGLAGLLIGRFAIVGPRAEVFAWRSVLLATIAIPSVHLVLAAASEAPTTTHACRADGTCCLKAAERTQGIGRIELGTAAAWGIIVSIGGGRWLIGRRRAVRIAREARPIAVDDRFAGVSETFGRAIPILESPTSIGPLTIGLFRRAIIVPRDFFRTFDVRQATVVLAHERAHVESRDVLWSAVASVVRIAVAWHPGAGLIERELRWAQERAADERAMATGGFDRPTYARLLLAALEQPNRSSRPVDLPTTVGADSELLRRFRSLDGRRSGAPLSRWTPLLLTLLLPLILPAMSPHSRAASIARGTGEPSVRSEAPVFSFETPLGCSNIATSDPVPGAQFRAVDALPDRASALHQVRLAGRSLLTPPRDLDPRD